MAGSTCCKGALQSYSWGLGLFRTGCGPAVGSAFLPGLLQLFQGSASFKPVRVGLSGRQLQGSHGSRLNVVRAGNKKKGASKSGSKKGGKGTAVLEREEVEVERSSNGKLEMGEKREERETVRAKTAEDEELERGGQRGKGERIKAEKDDEEELERGEKQEDGHLDDGFADEAEAAAFAAQFSDFFNADEDGFEEDGELDEDGDEYEEGEEDGPVEIDWAYGSDLGEKLGEVFDPIDLGLGKEWPKPWNEAPETYNWSSRTAARIEESRKLHRIDMSYVNAEEERKEKLKQKRKLRQKGLLKSRWDNEKEVFNDNELLSVNGRVIRGPEDAWAAWMADRGRDDILGTTDWKALGIEKPRPITFSEKLGKVTRAEALRRRKKARVDQDQEQYLHKMILDAKSLDEVLEATEAAFDEAGISYTGQVERDWVPVGALSSVNIAMAVHRVGRFAFREGMSRADKIQLMRLAPLQRLLQMAIEVVGRCDPQGVANMAWGLSRLAASGLLPTDYLDEVAKQAIRRLRKARPQHLANLAGAFASLNHASPALLDGVLVHACARGVAAFRPQEVAQIVWSCAVLNHKPTKFLDEIDAWVAEQTAKFEAEKADSERTTGSLRGPLPWREYNEPDSANPNVNLTTNPDSTNPSSDVSETVSAVSNNEPSEGEKQKASFLDTRASVVENGAQSAVDGGQNGASGAVNGSVPSTSGRSALEELSGQVDDLAGKVNELRASLRTSSDASTASGSASGASENGSGASDNGFGPFGNGSGASERGMSASGNGSEASESSPSQRPSFSQFFGIGAGNPFAEYRALQLANLAWAYAVLGETRRPAFARIWEEIERKKAAAFDERMMSQLWQARLTLTLEEPSMNLELEPPLLKQLAEKAWNAEKDAGKTVSTYQLELERALSDMGKQFEAEYTEADYSIDVALPADRIAFEVDGPSHFARNTGTPLGATLLKRRHLAAGGWTVLPINYNYWDTLKGEKEQQGYLKQLLRSAMEKENADELTANQ